MDWIGEKRIMKHAFVEASMQVVLLPQLKHSLSFILSNLSIRCCCSLYNRGVEGQVQDPLLGREVLRRVVLSLRRLPEYYLVIISLLFGKNKSQLLWLRKGGR